MDHSTERKRLALEAALNLVRGMEAVEAAHVVAEAQVIYEWLLPDSFKREGA